MNTDFGDRAGRKPKWYLRGKLPMLWFVLTVCAGLLLMALTAWLLLHLMFAGARFGPGD